MATDSTPSPAGSTYTTASESGPAVINDTEAATTFVSASEDPNHQAIASAINTMKPPSVTSEAFSISPASTVTSSGQPQPESARQTPVSAEVQPQVQQPQQPAAVAMQPPIPTPIGAGTIHSAATSAFESVTVSRFA